jgi:chitinase
MQFLLLPLSTISVVSASKNSSVPSGHLLPKNSSLSYKPLYQPYLNSTPVFQNHRILQALSSGSGSLSKRSTAALPDGVCTPGQPCTNGACCSDTGVCSYAPSSCSQQYCISNCDAKAPCGQYADPGNAICPLNVCCSQYGFCTYIVFHLKAA